MESGDQVTKNLRQQLNSLQEEFEAFKVKTRRDFDSMQESLGQKAMIREMQMNASNDKEFV